MTLYLHLYVYFIGQKNKNLKNELKYHFTAQDSLYGSICLSTDRE